MFEKYLQDIGLSDKEASVYLNLLQVDNASVIEISKKTNVNRSTVYVVLESLAKKGLVNETVIGKKVHYQAETPERLETYIERQKVNLEEKAKGLKDIISSLKSMQRESGTKPVVRYFEGREGVINTMEELFSKDYTDTSKDLVYFIYPKDLVDELFDDSERKKYREMRVKKKIESRVLYTWTKDKMQSDETGQRIKIDHEKYPLSCDISIYKDIVRISILGKKISGIFVKNIDFAETMRSLFKLAYDNIKNPQQ